MVSLVNYLDDRLPSRFWSKTAVVGECWVWGGYLDKDGYGYYWHEGKGRKPHRVAVAVIEALDEGLEIDHKCRNRACVNPAHLEQVTRKVNAERSAAAKLTCARGHPYTAENTYQKKAQRECKECVRQRNKRRYTRKES